MKLFLLSVLLAIGLSNGELKSKIPHELLAVYNLLGGEDIPHYLPFSSGPKERLATEDHGEQSTNPLFVTPYIKEGRAAEARQLAKVKPLAGDIESYAAFITVNEEYNSNLFFWFFPAKKDYQYAPVIIYIQGLLTESLLYGVFQENGPYELIGPTDVQLRHITWVNDYNVLYIDPLVGIGYSFTQNEDGYSRTPSDYGLNHYNAMLQFYELFPELRNNPLYTAGSHYGAKYAIKLADFTSFFKNDCAKTPNLQGIFIGNGFVEGTDQSYWSDYLYQLGVVDDEARKDLESGEKSYRTLIHHQDYTHATAVLFQIFFFIYRYTGLVDLHDYTKKNNVYINPFIEYYAQTQEFHDTVHVGPFRYQAGLEAFLYIWDDISRPFWDTVDHNLLQEYKSLVYSGQYGIKVPYTHTQLHLDNVDWPGSYDYGVAPKRSFHVDGELAGYYKISKNLTEAVVLHSGGLTDQDKPAVVYELLHALIRNKFQ
jgi:vitellogenic carboxypeptidase-like protein